MVSQPRKKVKGAYKDLARKNVEDEIFCSDAGTLCRVTFLLRYKCAKERPGGLKNRFGSVIIYLLLYICIVYLCEVSFYMKKDKKTEILNSIGFVAVALVLCLFMAFYGQMNTTTALYPICFERQESFELLAQDKEWCAETTASLRTENTASGKAALETLEHRQFSFSAKTAESLFISGGEDFTADFYDAGADTTVILLHGFERNVEFSLRYAEFWVDQGVNVLIPQLRGHDGLKGVNTLGYYEQYDLYDLLVAAQAETGVSEYIVHGEGSGAVAALLLSGNTQYISKLSENGISLKLIVAESAYTDMATVLKHQASRQFALSGFMTGTAINMTVKRNLGFSPKDVDVTAAVAQSSTPTLFVAGADDGFSPASWAETLYDAYSFPVHPEKSLLIVPEAGHGTAWEKYRESYENSIMEFLDGTIHENAEAAFQPKSLDTLPGGISSLYYAYLTQQT